MVFSGKVAVFKETRVNEAQLKNTTRIVSRKLTELGPGDSFGEMALMHGTPRSASIVAVELTHCIVLTQDTYIRVVQNMHSYQIQGTTDYFTNLPLLQTIPR